MDKNLKLVLLACLYQCVFVVLYISYSNRDWFFRTIPPSFVFSKLVSSSNGNYHLLNHTRNELHAKNIYQVGGIISRIKVGTANATLKDQQKTHIDKGRNTSVIEVDKASGRKTTLNSECKPAVPRLSTKPLPVTGLVSFPGAGNTWTRHLLQQVSGCYTVEPQWLEHLWDHGNLFEILIVRTTEGYM